MRVLVSTFHYGKHDVHPVLLLKACVVTIFSLTEGSTVVTHPKVFYSDSFQVNSRSGLSALTLEYFAGAPHGE